MSKNQGRSASRRAKLKNCVCVQFAGHASHQKTGGGERDRTDDLLLAKQALSQLSYTPVGCEAET
jgi:hypothetical protein